MTDVDYLTNPLRLWRVRQGLTIDEVADLSGLSVSLISRVERGEREMSPTSKVRLARALGVQVRDLFASRVEPPRVHLSAGVGLTAYNEQDTPVQAFDRALAEAGVGNWNLVHVSSMLPAGVVVERGAPTDIEPGTPILTAYSRIQDHDTVQAAVALGTCEHGGVIMEVEGRPKAMGESAEARARRYVESAFLDRGWRLDELHSIQAEKHRDQGFGVAVAVALLRNVAW